MQRSLSKGVEACRGVAEGEAAPGGAAKTRLF